MYRGIHLYEMPVSVKIDGAVAPVALGPEGRVSFAAPKVAGYQVVEISTAR